MCNALTVQLKMITVDLPSQMICFLEVKVFVGEGNVF